MAETERVTRETGIHWHRNTKGVRCICSAIAMNWS